MEDLTTFIANLVAISDATKTNVADMAKPGLIEGPMYIQQSLTEEPALADITDSLVNMYTGFILTALNLNVRIGKTEKIRDFIRPVTSRMDAGVEAFIDSDTLIANFGKEVVAATEKVEAIKDVNVPAGKLTSMVIPTANGKEATVFINTRLNPRSFPDQLVEYIIAGNFNEPTMNRFFRARAGELRFIRDFVFQIDKLEKRIKALKADRSGTLKDMNTYQRQGFFKTFTRIMLTILTNGKVMSSANVANAVLIVEENDFMATAKKLGFKISNFRYRQKFFAKIGCLFLVLVDTRYSRVSIYVNSIEHVGEYSFKDIKTGGGDKTSVTEVMEYIAKNQLPKF
jgi:hypothetical protein